MPEGEVMFDVARSHASASERASGNRRNIINVQKQYMITAFGLTMCPISFHDNAPSCFGFNFALSTYSAVRTFIDFRLSSPAPSYDCSETTAYPLHPSALNVAAILVYCARASSYSRKGAAKTGAFTMPEVSLWNEYEHRRGHSGK